MRDGDILWYIVVGTAHVSSNAGVIVSVIYSNWGTDLVNQQLDFARYTSGHTSVVISVGGQWESEGH